MLWKIIYVLVQKCIHILDVYGISIHIMIHRSLHYYPPKNLKCIYYFIFAQQLNKNEEISVKKLEVFLTFRWLIDNLWIDYNKIILPKKTIVAVGKLRCLPTSLGNSRVFLYLFLHIPIFCQVFRPHDSGSAWEEDVEFCFGDHWSPHILSSYKPV